MKANFIALFFIRNEYTKKEYEGINSIKMKSRQSFSLSLIFFETNKNKTLSNVTL